MVKFSRRHFLGASLSSLALGSLTGCATSNSKVHRQDLPASSRLQLLFYADTHAHWLPGVAHPAANNLGPMSLLGQPPYITETNLLRALSVPATDQVAASWLTAQGARAQRPGLDQMGGYAVLAQALAQKRQQFGLEASLTLEGGQCWNGSGLASLTQGRYGPVSSQWLGAEVKIASEEAELWPQQTEHLYQELGQPVLTAVNPISYFKKGGVDLAVVGCVNPWQQFAQGFNEQDWLAQLQQQVNIAAANSNLVILLSDAGTNPNLWLASKLQGVDVILSSRGQDVWPQLVRVETGRGASIPVVLAGSQGQGYAELVLEAKAQGWQISLAYHPLFSSVEVAQPQVAAEITRLRASYASWLEKPLATAPGWLYRRDSLAGSWDQLIAEALKSSGAEFTLAPGLRHGLAVPPGGTITREHLLSLTGGYPASVFKVPASRSELQARLEAGADQFLSDDWFLHTSEDLPRLTGGGFTLRYQALAGQRIAALEWPVSSTSDKVQVAGWSPHYLAEGVTLWQLMEEWLLQQPAKWQLPEVERPSLAFVDGHPGWHPEALL